MHGRVAVECRGRLNRLERNGISIKHHEQQERELKEEFLECLKGFNDDRLEFIVDMLLNLLYSDTWHKAMLSTQSTCPNLNALETCPSAKVAGAP